LEPIKNACGALRYCPLDLEIVFDDGCDMIFKVNVLYLPFFVFVFYVEMIAISNPGHPAY
jgi:hypothetical protein